jgi:hypothetical protein
LTVVTSTGSATPAVVVAVKSTGNGTQVVVAAVKSTGSGDSEMWASPSSDTNFKHIVGIDVHVAAFF